MRIFALAVLLASSTICASCSEESEPAPESVEPGPGAASLEEEPVPVSLDGVAWRSSITVKDGRPQVHPDEEFVSPEVWWDFPCSHRATPIGEVVALGPTYRSFDAGCVSRVEGGVLTVRFDGEDEPAVDWDGVGSAGDERPVGVVGEVLVTIKGVDEFRGRNRLGEVVWSRKVEGGLEFHWDESGALILNVTSGDPYEFSLSQFAIDPRDGAVRAVRQADAHLLRSLNYPLEIARRSPARMERETVQELEYEGMRVVVRDDRMPYRTVQVFGENSGGPVWSAEENVGKVRGRLFAEIVGGELHVARLRFALGVESQGSQRALEQYSVTVYGIESGEVRARFDYRIWD